MVAKFDLSAAFEIEEVTRLMKIPQPFCAVLSRLSVDAGALAIRVKDAMEVVNKKWPGAVTKTHFASNLLTCSRVKYPMARKRTTYVNRKAAVALLIDDFKKEWKKDDVDENDVVMIFADLPALEGSTAPSARSRSRSAKVS
jgi:hypothetical protein